jgi:hypothetical protein
MDIKLGIMTEKLPNNIEPMISKIKPSHDQEHGPSEAAAFLNQFLDQAKQAPIHPTVSRHEIGRQVFSVFIWFIMVSLFTGCLLSIFGTKEKMENLISLLQILGTILTPVVGFIGGYYFGKTSDQPI